MTGRETIGEGSGMGQPDKKSGADASSPQNNPKKEKSPRIVFGVGQVWQQPREKGATLTVEKNNNGMFRVRIKGEDHLLYGTSLEMSKSEVERILKSGSYTLTSRESPADNQEKVADGGDDLAPTRKEVHEPVPVAEESLTHTKDEERSVSTPPVVEAAEPIVNNENGGVKPMKAKSLEEAMRELQKRQGVEPPIEVEVNHQSPSEEEQEMLIDHSFEVGQRWESINRKSRLHIDEKRGDGKFVVLITEVVTDDNGKVWTKDRREFLNRKDLERKIVLDGYTLIAGTAKKLDGAETLVSDEEIPTEDEGHSKDPARSPAPLVDGTSSQEEVKEEKKSLLFDEFDLLDNAIEKAINEIAEPVSQNIKKILEENKDILGKDYHVFFKKQKAIARTLNKINHEDEALFDAIEKSKNLVLEQLIEKQKLKEKAESFSEELLKLEKVVKESIKIHKKDGAESTLDPKPKPEAKTVSTVEKIGEEKYEDLCALVRNVWQGLGSSLEGRTVSEGDRNKVWTTILLPLLKEEINNFLQEHTDLGEDEYEVVIGTLITKQGLPVRSEVFKRSDPERRNNMKQ